MVEQVIHIDKEEQIVYTCPRCKEPMEWENKLCGSCVDELDHN